MILENVRTSEWVKIEVWACGLRFSSISRRKNESFNMMLYYREDMIPKDVGIIQMGCEITQGWNTGCASSPPGAS